MVKDYVCFLTYFYTKTTHTALLFLPSCFRIPVFCKTDKSHSAYSNLFSHPSGNFFQPFLMLDITKLMASRSQPFLSSPILIHTFPPSPLHFPLFMRVLGWRSLHHPFTYSFNQLFRFHETNNTKKINRRLSKK